MASCKTDSDCGRLNFCNVRDVCEHVPTFPAPAEHIVMFVLIGVISGKKEYLRNKLNEFKENLNDLF